MKIGISSVCHALDHDNTGSKVVAGETFRLALLEAVENFTFPENGQGYIPLTCLDAVSCGVAKRQNLNVNDCVVRYWRGEICLFAKRQHAVKTESLAVIVYTREAYFADPEVTDDERESLKDTTHVLVAVLASAGPAPLSSARFVRNLAGGNNAYKPENGYTLDKAREEAKAIVAYEQEWITVSD